MISPGQLPARLARRAFPCAVVATVALGLLSMVVGVSEISLPTLLSDRPEAAEAWQLLWTSRLPRTLAVVLSGMAVSVAGLIMQLMARNRFVEPSTTGTNESAMLGLVLVTLLAPGAEVILKMAVAAGAACLGTAVFLLVLRRLPSRNTLLVPLVGIVFGGVIGAAATFLAYEFDLLQTLNTWMLGDFSAVIQGRYELLWLVALLTVLGYLCADRFTVMGLGEEFTTNLGMNFRLYQHLALLIVSIISAVVVVCVGAIPFLGLVVPNLVALSIGDSARRSLPWVAVFGAAFVLLCDIVSRVIRYPYEVPVGMVVAVIGGALFLALLLRQVRREEH